VISARHGVPIYTLKHIPWYGQRNITNGSTSVNRCLLQIVGGTGRERLTVVCLGGDRSDRQATAECCRRIAHDVRRHAAAITLQHITR